MVDFFKAKRMIWTNTKTLERLEVAFLFISWIFLGWLLTSPDAPQAAGIFFALMTIAGVAYAGKEHVALQTVGFGKSRNKFWLSIAVGAALALALSSSQFAFTNPALQNIAFTLPIGISATVLFTGFFAPVVEESLFRGTLQPTLAEWTSNGTIALFGQAFAFAIFHWWVAGANPSIIPLAFAFGLIGGVGNIFFQSTGFSYALHMVNNLRVLGVI